MSQTFNLNAFSMTAMKGSPDTVVSPNTIPCVVDPNSTNTLLPGDAVYLTGATGAVYFVDKCTANQVPFGFVIYNMKGSQVAVSGIGEGFTANQAVEIAGPQSIFYAEAGGTVTRGNSLEFSSQNTTVGPQMIVSAGINPVSAIALDNAVVNGLMRVYVLPQASTGLKAVYAITAAATIAIAYANGETQTLTPGQNETLNAAVVVPNSRLYFVITTSGTLSYTLTFGTNFKSVGTLATGTVSGKVFTITFVGDGVNYNEVARTTAM